MQSVSPSVLDGGGKQIEATRFRALNVEKHCTPLEVFMNLLQRGIANHFKEGMTRCHPFQGRIALEQFLVETNAAVFPPKPAKAGFQRIAALDEQPRYLANPVSMAFRTRGLGSEAHHGSGLH